VGLGGCLRKDEILALYLNQLYLGANACSGLLAKANSPPSCSFAKANNPPICSFAKANETAIHGINEASLGYFRRLPAQLSLAQAAMLAALAKAPSAFRPDRAENYAHALIRRNWVLTRMQKEGFISIAVAALAISAPLFD
jgi:membrane peptidoglycan carboxypeptidase